MTKQKRSTLDLGSLTSSAGTTHNPVDVLEVRKSGKARTRIGKVAIQGWVDKPIRAELKKVAIERETTCDSLIEEAIRDVLAKYGVDL